MPGGSARGVYEERMAEIRGNFESSGDGLQAAAARSALVDGLVMQFWEQQVAANPKLAKGVAVCAIGGFGRGHLFPYSDVDLMFSVDKGAEKLAKEPIRSVSQSLWDCGLQLSFVTRPPGECERLDVANPEFALALLDLRQIGGDQDVFARLNEKCVAKLRARDGKAIGEELAKLTSERHAKFGDTLFHLEPNIKDCPGGLRDANVRQWLVGLRTGKNPQSVGGALASSPSSEEFQEAVAFLASVRCFLHYRHERDDNTLDWQAQDAAARHRIGLPGTGRGSVDAAYWMRAYFRHARVVEKCLLREAESAGLEVETAVDCAADSRARTGWFPDQGRGSGAEWDVFQRRRRRLRTGDCSGGVSSDGGEWRAALPKQRRADCQCDSATLLEPGRRAGTMEAAICDPHRSARGTCLAGHARTGCAGADPAGVPWH